MTFDSIGEVSYSLSISKKEQIQTLEDVESDYSEIVNDGIRQRVDLYKNSIKTNPDNPNTLKQIEIFRANLLQQFEEYQNKKEDMNYVAGVFSKALGGNVNQSNDGQFHISGSIEGVPISVKLNQNDNKIDFDTPTDGSCQKGLEAIQKKLIDANINLGAIKVLKTGQTINNRQNNRQNRKEKA